MRKFAVLSLLVFALFWVHQAIAQTTSYTTPGTYTYTVPAGCTSVGIDMAGAQGGNTTTGSQGGRGGRAQGVLAVTPGQTLNVYVGGQGAAGNTSGTNTAGGTNGGGGGRG